MSFEETYAESPEAYLPESISFSPTNNISPGYQGQQDEENIYIPI